MRKTRDIIDRSDLVLYLVDSTVGMQREDRELLEEYRDVADPLPLWTKVDLNGRLPPEGFLAVSAASGAGLDKLHREIRNRIMGNVAPESGDVVIDSLRQKELLEGCLAALRSFRDGLRRGLPLDVVAVDLREALDRLGEITGQVTSEEVLREMFSRFCVGK
jgi:tRNA modification GTPase